MRRLLCFWCCLPCNHPCNRCVLSYKWYIILWCLIHCLVLGPCRLFACEVSTGDPRYRLMSGEKSLPAMGALVRGKKSHLTAAVSPVNAALWTFSYLTKEPSLDSLELPVCSGPVIGVHVFSTWAQLERRKVPSWRSSLQHDHILGSQTRSLLTALHPLVYWKCSHASSGPFDVTSHIWNNDVIEFFPRQFSSFHKQLKCALTSLLT